jgi:hypothetical protein
VGREDKEVPKEGEPLREEPLEGFGNLEEAREYVARYLLNYINLELEGLPREEWGRTVETWVKICGFAKALLKKSDRERRELYRRFRFDFMMEGVAEDVRRTFLGFMKIGIVGEDEDPREFLLKAVELVRGRRDLMERWELNPSVIEFLREFLSSGRK